MALQTSLSTCSLDQKVFNQPIPIVSPRGPIPHDPTSKRHYTKAIDRSHIGCMDRVRFFTLNTVSQLVLRIYLCYKHTCNCFIYLCYST